MYLLYLSTRGESRFLYSNYFLFQSFLVWVRNCSSPRSCNTYEDSLDVILVLVNFLWRKYFSVLHHLRAKKSVYIGEANQEQNSAGKVSVLVHDCWRITKSSELSWTVFIFPISLCPPEYLWSRILPLDLMILEVFPNLQNSIFLCKYSCRLCLWQRGSPCIF